MYVCLSEGTKETHASPAQLHCCHQPMNLWEKCEQSHSDFQCKNILEVLTVFLLMSTLLLLYKKFGRSTSEWVKDSTEKDSWAMLTEGLIVEGRLVEI